MDSIKHTWPTAWLEAAVQFGFARYVGNGEFVFISDAMRDKLGEFAQLVSESARADIVVELPLSVTISDGTVMLLRDETIEAIQSQGAGVK
jgi:hypothetical protein